MEYFDLKDSRMIKSLRLPKSGNQLRFLIQRVPSGRISNPLSIPQWFDSFLSAQGICHNIFLSRMIVPAFLKELIGMVHGLQVLILELSRFEILLGELEITSSDWPFVFVVPGLMTHLVASITLDSARSCVVQGAFLTQGTVFSIPTVLSWGGSIRPEGLLSFVLLWLVIIVAVVGGGVTVVVVVKISSVVKLLFVIT
nr:hypothetical protein [Tanacetum cinerariifolium]